MIAIDKNIPVPTGKSRLREGKYPFANMEVGDSFFISEESRRVWTASYGWGKRNAAKFRMTALSEGGAEGVRVWRVE